MPEGVRIVLDPDDGGEPYIAFYKPDGNLLFSSRDKLFRVTDVLRGSYAWPSRLTPLTATQTVTLGSCHESADAVQGWIKINYGGVDVVQQYVPEDAWMYVSGSYVTTWAGRMAVYTFKAADGVVFVEEQLGIQQVTNEVGQTFPYVAGTMQYELWCGTFV